MIGLVNFNRPPRNFQEVKDMLLHLEDRYRMAAISEKEYAEKKERYSNMLKNPEDIENVSDKIENDKRKMEREDVKMFLDSLEEQYSNGEINKEDYENIKLFEFSTGEGVFARPGSGELISLMLRNSATTRTLDKYSERMNPDASNILYYRIPGMAELEIQRDGIPLYKDRIEVQQYGTVVSTPVLFEQ